MEILKHINVAAKGISHKHYAFRILEMIFIHISETQESQLKSKKNPISPLLIYRQLQTWGNQ